MLTLADIFASAVPIDGDGIIPDKLEQSLEAHMSMKPRELGRNKPFWSMLYLIPTFHNPTGVCLSPGIYIQCSTRLYRYVITLRVLVQ